VKPVLKVHGNKKIEQKKPSISTGTGIPILPKELEQNHEKLEKGIVTDLLDNEDNKPFRLKNH